MGFASWFCNACMQALIVCMASSSGSRRTTIATEAVISRTILSTTRTVGSTSSNLRFMPSGNLCLCQGRHGSARRCSRALHRPITATGSSRGPSFMGNPAPGSSSKQTERLAILSIRLMVSSLPKAILLG